MRYEFGINYVIEIDADSFEDAREMAYNMIPMDAVDRDIDFLGEVGDDIEEVIFDHFREKEIV